jgi:hypothetical protein
LGFRPRHGFIDVEFAIARRLANEAQDLAGGFAWFVASKPDICDSDGISADERIARLIPPICRSRR